MKMYQVDAFTDTLFSGNPAAICPLESWIEASLMQHIAAENNLSETAFFVGAKGDYQLRWFTPTIEVDLCGHATLAAAYVIFQYVEPAADCLEFTSRSGRLCVLRQGDTLQMDFPAETLRECTPPRALIAGLRLDNDQEIQVYCARDYFVVLQSEQQIRGLQPDFQQLAQLDLRGVCVTAIGDKVDFVSRFFAPNAGINEDPVTGSAHCALTPYWVNRLGRNPLKARQISSRGGSLLCSVVLGSADQSVNPYQPSRVTLSGQCKLYMEAEVFV